MALNVARLQAALEPTLYDAFEEFFGPLIPSGITGTQTSRVQEGWTRLAKAIAKGVAIEVIKEIDDNAEVNGVTSTPGAQAGGSTLPGTFTGQVD